MMTTDKHSQDAMAKLYAEWVSAGVKLSVAGFAATTKIMEAATQSLVSSRARTQAGEAAKAGPSSAAEKPEAKAPAVTPLKTVPTAAKPADSEPAAPEVIAKPESKAVPAQAESEKAATAQAAAKSPAAAANDLKLVSGIGPKLEQLLIRKGLLSFAQIAALSSDDVAKLDAELKLNGRIQRDDWVGQAATLAGNIGGQTWQN